MSHRVPSRDGSEERDIFDDLRFSTLSPEQSLVNQESEKHSQEVDDVCLAMINDRFKDDAQIEWIVKGAKEGKAAHEIQKLSGMTKTQYESAQRRWRRGLEKLFPERSDL